MGCFCSKAEAQHGPYDKKEKQGELRRSLLAEQEEGAEEEESKSGARFAKLQTAAGAASDAKALAGAMQGGDLNGAAKAAIAFAEKAIALRDAKGAKSQAKATKELAEASERAAARIEAEGKSPLGKVMAGMAKAASKIKTLEKFAHMIPLMGPTAGGMLHGLAQVCEVAARFQADSKARRCAGDAGGARGGVRAGGGRPAAPAAAGVRTSRG